MKTLETIYNKLNSVEKTELETHKVELAIVDDISKTINNIKSERKKIATAKKDLEKANDNALDAREKGVDVFQRGMSIREDALKIAKELGVKANDVKGFKDLDKDLDLLNKEYQELLKMVN